APHPWKCVGKAPTPCATEPTTPLARWGRADPWEAEKNLNSLRTLVSFPEQSQVKICKWKNPPTPRPHGRRVWEGFLDRGPCSCCFKTAAQQGAAATVSRPRRSAGFSMELRGTSLLLCLFSLLTQVPAEPPTSKPSLKIKKAANVKKDVVSPKMFEELRSRLDSLAQEVALLKEQQALQTGECGWPCGQQPPLPCVRPASAGASPVPSRRLSW
uniref:Uncharacterized protein n=1 Tax=Oryctolagus cuniculus TaxID=9986 RepID=A0A5F9CZ06_RABIT